MYEARALYQLQVVDLELDAALLEFEQIQDRIGETDELVTARQKSEDARLHQHELQTAQKELEWEVERLTDKITPEEQKLYHGQIRNPKEVDSLRKNVEIEKANRRAIEDRILDLMSENEQADEELKDARDELTGILAAWEADQAELVRRQTELKTRIEQLERSRKSAAAPILPEFLANYEELRRTKRGRAVSRIERDTCQGCRIALPVTVVGHVRTGRDVVHCPSCGRVLFAER